MKRLSRECLKSMSIVSSSSFKVSIGEQEIGNAQDTERKLERHEKPRRSNDRWLSNDILQDTQSWMHHLFVFYPTKPSTRT